MLREETSTLYVTSDDEKWHCRDDAIKHERWLQLKEYFDNIVLHNIQSHELAQEIVDDWDNFKRLLED